MGLVDLLITIITLIVVYKLFEQDKVKEAFILRLVVGLGSLIFIQGYDINKIFYIAQFINNGVLFMILYFILLVIWLYITNSFEYYAAFKPYGHMIVVYIFVCILIEFATEFVFIGASTLLEAILHIRL